MINVDIEQVEQGVDYSGQGSSRVRVTGNVRHAFNNGAKLAHAHYADNIAGLNIQHPGRYGVLLSGPNDSEALPYQRELRVSGVAISEVGSNSYYKGVGSTTMGVGLDRNSSDSLRASFPKNVVAEGNVISSHTGSVVVTRSGGDLVMADGSFPVSTGKPVTFTATGTLPTGLSLATTYWLGWDETSLTVRVATSYINALDGVFLTLSGGSGTHTMTGKSFMDYGGFIDAAAVKDRAAPNYFRDNIVVGATVSDSSGFAGTFAHIGTSNTQTITDNTWTDLILDGVSPGADFLGKIDAGNLYNTSTGVFTLTAGVWNVSGVAAFAANGSGIRDARVMVDDGSGYKILWPYRRTTTPSASDPGEVAFQEVAHVGAAGALLKVQVRQSIGGGWLATHVNSRLSVERVG